MKIVFVRHGQSVANRDRIIQGHLDSPLSDLGRKEAEDLAVKMKQEGYQFDVIFSSDLSRASVTAQTIAKKFDDIPIVYSKALREMHHGSYQGQSANLSKEDKAFFEKVWENDTLAIPGGECIRDFYIRVKKFYDEMITEYNINSNCSILIVAHGGTLYRFLNDIMAVFPETEEWFGNCMISEVESTEDGSWKLTKFNSKQI